MAMRDDTIPQEAIESLESTVNVLSDHITKFVVSQNIVGSELRISDMTDENVAASAIIFLGTLINFDTGGDQQLTNIIRKAFEDDDMPKDLAVTMNLFLCAVSRARFNLSALFGMNGENEGHC